MVSHTDIFVAMAKHAPKLARGYTRAREFIFDSDDDAPLPELPILSDCISPPPPKRETSSAAPIHAAPHGNEAPNVQMPARFQQPEDFQHGKSSSPGWWIAGPPPPKIQDFFRTEPTHRHRKPPYLPPSDVPTPKPAKGCLRDMEQMQHPIGYTRPPISTGYNHVVGSAPWRSVEIKQISRMEWPLWGRGIVDLRPVQRPGKTPMVAGRLLRHAMSEAKRIIRMTACEHKVGMCKCPYDRFSMYQSSESSWQPWVMCLLGSTSTREGSLFFEASLIYEFERDSTNIEHNTNWLKSCDYGGEGPRADGEAHEEHFVYLAVVPVGYSPQW